MGCQSLLFGTNNLKTICMECQNLYTGKNKENVSVCHLLTFVL